MRGNRIRKIMAAGLCALLLCGLFTPAVSEEYRELKYGSKGDDVQRFKKAMFWLGYFSTEDLDGTYTATTADRVKKLQKNNGLRQTGIADAALQELVFSGNAVGTDTAPSPSPVPPPTPVPTATPEPTPFPYDTSPYETLTEGMTGDAVQKLKKAMYWLGYFNSENLSDEYNEVTVNRAKQLQKANGLPETGEADPILQALVYSGNAVKTKNAPRPSSVPPTPKPPLDINALMPPLNADGFLSDEADTDEYVYVDEDEGVWIYVTSSLSIVLRRYEDKKAVLTWYEADVHASPASPLLSYLNGEKHPGTAMIQPAKFVEKYGMVLAFNDDHFGFRIEEKDKGIPPGVIIRDRQIIYDKTWSRESFPNLDVLAVFPDGSMKTFPNSAHTAQEYLDMGAVHTYAFGPTLLRDGELSEYMLREEYYSYREPRMAMGMIEPWHYYVLCVEGRMGDSGRSKGVYLNWLADNMKEHGVQEAINLDGGGTACLMFMGKKINKSANSTRTVGSMTGFGVSALVGGEQ